MIKANGYFYASYYCNDSRLRYPTGVKITDTSKSSQLLLAKIDKTIIQYVESKRRLEEPILAAELYDHLDTVLGKERKGQSTFFYDYDNMLADMQSGLLLKKDGGRFSDATIKNARVVKNALQVYEKATGFKFTYGFSLEDYNRYLGWLTSNGKSKNTIAGNIAYLTGFLSKMYDAQKHKNAAFKDFSFKGEEADTVYLSVEEITNIYNLALKGAQERARDIFVFGCWVALRAKDLSRINQFERRGEVFEILTAKTGEKVVIPIHWMADRIYKKYNGSLPVYSTPEGLNYHLPAICRQAGITERRLVAMTKGGRRQAEYFDKCDLISIHSARRCFATNMYLQNFPVRAIMKITGHRTEKAFFNYIRIDKEENAKLMIEHPFFKPPSESSLGPGAE